MPRARPRQFSPVADDHGQPIEPHIVAVADAYDAMTSTRSYRRALTQDIAFAELRKNSGRQFHPRVVDALIAALRRRGAVHGDGHELYVHHMDAPRDGVGSAGLGDLLPEGEAGDGTSAVGTSAPRGHEPVRLAPRVAVLVVVTVTAAMAVELWAPGGRPTGLVALTGAVVAGELLVLRPRHRGPVPLSYAYMLVIIRAFPVPEALGAIAVAELLAVLLRSEPTLTRRVERSAHHLIAGVAGLAVYAVLWPLRPMNATAWMLTVLAASSVTMLVVHEAITFVRTRRVPPVGGPDLALVASGMLMAVGFRGVGGHESLGLWGVALFSVPLLAAWFSYERLAVISRTSEQTIVALSVVPEMAGLARDGHAARVAALSVQVGDVMGLRRAELDDLRAAALLHHLGHLCLDAPEVREEPIEPFEVADKGAEILRQTDLACAGDLLATDAVTVGGQILRLASAYDDLREEHDASDSLDALSAGPGFLYDRRVFDAFERVVSTAPGRLTLPDVDLVLRGEVDRPVAAAWPRRRGRREPTYASSTMPTASTMSPTEIAASTGSPNTIWSERNTATSESRVGRCFTVVSRGMPSATLYGIPRFSAITIAFSAMPSPISSMPAGAEVRRAEPEQRDVRQRAGSRRRRRRSARGAGRPPRAGSGARARRPAATRAGTAPRPGG